MTLQEARGSTKLMTPRSFDLDEANALLPQLTRLIEEIRTAQRQLHELRQRLEEIGRLARGNGHALERRASGLTGRRMRRLRRFLEEATERTQALGCELKDVDQGLVDFRSYRDGREVYLCWRLGEDRIRYWHELDSGFAGRQPL